MKINEIATWFYANNEKVRNDKTDALINILCLFTKATYLHLGYEDIGPLKIQIFDNSNVKIDMGITKALEYNLTKEEEHILNTINRYCGYNDILELLNVLTDYEFFTSNLDKLQKGEEVTIDNDLLTNSLNLLIKDMLKTYENYDFDKEEVIILGDTVFFTEKGTNLTEEEKKSLTNYRYMNEPDQRLFDLSRHENGKLVIW